MSASTDRLTRRQIRRAFGPDAAEVFREHQELIAGHHLAIADLIKSRDALAERIRAETYAREQAEFDLRERVEYLQRVGAQRPRTFWQRVRWIVRGQS